MVCSRGESLTYRAKQMLPIYDGSVKDLPLETRDEPKKIDSQSFIQFCEYGKLAVLFVSENWRFFACAGASFLSAIGVSLENLPSNTQVQQAVSSTMHIESATAK